MSIISLEKAKEVILSGGIVAMPTETVYGLAGSIFSEKALHLIFKTKERPFFDPLIVHIAKMEQMNDLVLNISEIEKLLAKEFWPGPLTIVFDKSSKVSDLITSGLNTVAVRMPEHDSALALIASTTPLAAPSANKFGKTSPTQAEHVLTEFGDEVFVLEGGATRVGVESTVLRVEKNWVEILRPGAVTKEMIENLFTREGISCEVKGHQISKHSPGHLEDHYMPDKAFYLLEDLTQLEKLAPRRGVEMELNSDPAVAAREIYQQMRELSKGDQDFIYCVKKEQQHSGLWVAIWDRLKKASSKNIKFD